MGKCLSCFRPSAKESDFNINISPAVVKEPKPKTWAKKVEADLNKLATHDVTEKSLKQLYCNPPKKESATSLPRPVVNVNISAGESLSDSRSTLSSFFDHTCDDWSPKVAEALKNATTDLQDKSDEDVTSSTSEVKQEIQEPELIRVDESTKQVDSAHSIDSSNWDDSVTSSSDLGEASKLLKEIDTATGDESSAQSVDESLNTKSNKAEGLDATEPQPNDSFSSLFDEEESKLLQDILKEDQQRQEMNAAAEDEIELTADLCLLGTCIRKDPNWRPNADVPDDLDADGLEEVYDDSETSADASSSDMDNADTRPIDGRDMIQDILRDDQQRVRLSATPDDDTDLPIARPMPAGVFHGRELGEPDRRRNDVDEIRPRTRRGRLEMIENSTPRPKTRRRRTEGQGLSRVNTSVNGHGDTPMVSYDEEESNLMDEILREQEAKLNNDESFMDEIVATAELSILGTAEKQ
ncbi:hypothetical protein AC249_AIPGENE28872 [Exaiptasia diaphana]|nr:hypothetical protein AC249_AIPGENE28872 [Exaiptasia diaphana]